MKVVPAVPLEKSPLPGIHHATLAGSSQGLANLSLWEQIIDAGCGTPPHRHDCEEVVLCRAGRGVLIHGTRQLVFGPNMTVCIPPNEDHQIVNAGDEPLHLVAVFSQSPVRAFLPDGQPITLPWAS